MMNTLESRNKKIRELRAKKYTLEFIGNMFAITRERVRQIVKNEIRQQKLIVKANTISKTTGMGSGARDRYRELIRIRDGYTCQLCDWKWVKGERRLDIHHLDEQITGKIDTKADLKTSYDFKHPERCITLCHRCHLRLHHRILNKMKY